MNHYDDYTLELFVLESPSVAKLRAGIEEHLLECHGCSEMVEEMRQFHTGLEEDLRDTREDNAVLPERMTKSHRELQVLFEEEIPRQVAPSARRLVRFRYFIRRHPVATAAGFFGTAVMFGFFISFLLPRSSGVKTPSDTRFANYHLNPAANSIDVLNKRDEVLWVLKSNTPVGVEMHAPRIAMCDLHGDGENELLTTLALADYPAPLWSNRLRIFDHNRNLQRTFEPTEKVPYRGREGIYDPNFNVDAVLTHTNSSTGKKEIYVGGNSIGRSPYVIFRLSENCDIMGEYWHFGHISSMKLVRIAGFDREVLITTGVNDSDDQKHKEFAVVVVLDPEKITGKTRATAFPQYALDPSGAEIYYIGLTETDLNGITHNHAMGRVVDTSGGTFSVVAGTTIDGGDCQMNFYFDEGMGIEKVLSGNTLDRIRQSYVDKGLLHGRVDGRYLEAMKSGVRYWDGSRWRNFRTAVHVQQVAGR